MCIYICVYPNICGRFCSLKRENEFYTILLFKPLQFRYARFAPGAQGPRLSSQRMPNCSGAKVPAVAQVVDQCGHNMPQSSMFIKCSSYSLHSTKYESFDFSFNHLPSCTVCVALFLGQTLWPDLCPR